MHSGISSSVCASIVKPTSICIFGNLGMSDTNPFFAMNAQECTVLIFGLIHP